MPSFFDLQKFAATGIAAPDMTAFDKARALAAFGGGKTRTLTSIPPLSFRANGKPLISWSMSGNGSQTGTPTPDSPIMPTFCGTLSDSDWTIPITCAGQTVPVYLGQVQTVRRIRKWALTGEETGWKKSNGFMFNEVIQPDYLRSEAKTLICSHYNAIYGVGSGSDVSNGQCALYRATVVQRLYIRDNNFATVDNFKAYLAAQYAAGTPVTVWYVLAETETGIVNEPLCKIGDYADELSSEDAGVTIPTAKGQNTLTVDTELQPYEMTITFKG